MLFLAHSQSSMSLNQLTYEPHSKGLPCLQLLELLICDRLVSVNVITHTFVGVNCLTETKIQILCYNVNHTHFHIAEIGC